MLLLIEYKKAKLFNNWQVASGSIFGWFYMHAKSQSVWAFWSSWHWVLNSVWKSLNPSVWLVSEFCSEYSEMLSDLGFQEAVGWTLPFSVLLRN